MNIAHHYSRFHVADRLLLTGHSHQAWPDVAAAAMQECFNDAALLVDEKWDRAFAKAEQVRAGFRRLLDDSSGHITLMQNTHDAVVRFLSALPLQRKRHIVTSDEEFHTLRRQLTRLSEEGIEVTRAPVTQLIDALRPTTAAVMVSTVSFLTAHVMQDLQALYDACEHQGVPLFLDVYHHLNVVPFSLATMPNAFVTGGGYKYCQLGEGNCFLRFPRDCQLRPVITGWFAEFGDVTGTSYGADRFAGATYDPVSHYRAAAVFQFFADEGLTVERLRARSQQQIARISNAVDALGLQRQQIPPDRIAGFVAVRDARASVLVKALRDRGVLADARGDTLRLGPAPYVSDAQIDRAMAVLAEVV